jgi:hypothetical protein
MGSSRLGYLRKRVERVRGTFSLCGQRSRRYRGLPIGDPEATRSTEIARAVHSIARGASRNALRQLMTRAQAEGIPSGPPPEMAERFSALLGGGLMVELLLGVAERPPSQEMARRARTAMARCPSAQSLCVGIFSPEHRRF